MVEWRGADRLQPVRAWLRRPGSLRVEAMDGELLTAERDETLGGTIAPLSPGAPRPEFDADGLVAHRPRSGYLHYDDPMYVNYQWVAMLDPAEFADGVVAETGEPGPAPVSVAGLSEVEHHGRTAWQAELRPNWTYDPRCGCCPLLPSEVSDYWEAEAGGPTMREYDPDVRYADAHRVRLDVATGVCVYTEEIGGSRAGTGHDMRIDAVDESMPDYLFRS